MMVPSCNWNTEARQKDHELEASLSHLARSYLKKKKKIHLQFLELQGALASIFSGPITWQVRRLRTTDMKWLVQGFTGPW
jgi:hypothetical protein